MNLKQSPGENTCIRAWFSGHFHLSHDYEEKLVCQPLLRY